MDQSSDVENQGRPYELPWCCLPIVMRFFYSSPNLALKFRSLLRDWFQE